VSLSLYTGDKRWDWGFGCKIFITTIASKSLCFFIDIVVIFVDIRKVHEKWSIFCFYGMF
jgi:hypothetical protein